jgi:hypothetical protein
MSRILTDGRSRVASSAPPPRLMPRWRSAALLLALAGTWACEGDNLFSGDSEFYQPRVLTLSAASEADGRTVDVLVSGAAVRGIARIDVSLTGAFVKDTSVILDGEPTQTSQVIRIAVPAAVQDTLLLVSAFIVDAAGSASGVAQTSAVVSGPPAVISVNAPTSVTPGSIVLIHVQASGTHPITELLFQFRGAIVRDTVVAASGTRTVSLTLPVQLPSVVLDTVLHVSVSARDNQGRTGPAQVAEVPLTLAPPTVSILDKPSVLDGLRNMRLRIGANSTRPLEAIRIEMRHATTRDTVVQLPAGHFQVFEDVNIQLLASELVSQNLVLRVSAQDVGGARSSVVVDSLVVLTNETVIAPNAPILTHAASVVGGGTLDVRVRASSDVRPIVALDIRVRGVLDSGAGDFSAEINPSRHDIVRDYKIRVPCEVAEEDEEGEAVAVTLSGTVEIHVVASDAATVLSPIAVSTFEILPAGACPVNPAFGIFQSGPGGLLVGSSPFNLSNTGQRLGER